MTLNTTVAEYASRHLRCTCNRAIARISSLTCTLSSIFKDSKTVTVTIANVRPYKYDSTASNTHTLTPSFEASFKKTATTTYINIACINTAYRTFWRSKSSVRQKTLGTVRCDTVREKFRFVKKSMRELYIVHLRSFNNLYILK
jgi:hypothetical protein